MLCLFLPTVHNIKMPELTEATEAKPEVKVEVESGSDSDSDDSVPELEDGINEAASKVRNIFQIFFYQIFY